MSEPWRVFAIDDYYWWVARSLEEACDDYVETFGPMENFARDDAYELSDEQLDRLTFTDSDENERPTGIVRTFRQEFRRRLDAGLSQPEMFGCTES